MTPSVTNTPTPATHKGFYRTTHIQRICIQRYTIPRPSVRLAEWMKSSWFSGTETTFSLSYTVHCVIWKFEYVKN